MKMIRPREKDEAGSKQMLTMLIDEFPEVMRIACLSMCDYAVGMFNVDVYHGEGDRFMNI